MKLIQPRLNYSFNFRSIVKSLRNIFLNVNNSNYLYSLFDSKEIYFFNHARNGLTQILSLLPQGTVVGVQPFTCSTVLESIERANCKIYFIDINDQFVINTEALQRCVNKIDVLILTHTFGSIVSFENIRKIMGNKLVIEDCAHAFLSRENDELAGKRGDFSIFSFGFGKFLSSLSGGFVMVNNEKFISLFSEKYNLVPVSGIISELKNFIFSLLSSFLHLPFFYTFITINLKRKNYNHFKTKLSKITKAYKSSIAVFNLLIDQSPSLLDIQKKNANTLFSSVKKNSYFEICQELTMEDNGFMLPVKVSDPDKFINSVLKEGIEIGKHFYRSKYFINDFGYKSGSCPHYEKLIEQYVVLPTHYAYPSQKIKCLSEFIERYKNE